MGWKMTLAIAGGLWLLFLVYLAERGDARARRQAARRQRWLAKWHATLMDEDQLTDEQADRLITAVRNHPAGHTPRKRYYR